MAELNCPKKMFSVSEIVNDSDSLYSLICLIIIKPLDDIILAHLQYSRDGLMLFSRSV